MDFKVSLGFPKIAKLLLSVGGVLVLGLLALIVALVMQ